jgi:glutaredoxin
MTFFGFPICKQEVAEKLQQEMNKEPAFVVSSTHCPYCNKAKNVLKKYGIGHHEIMLDKIQPQSFQEDVANCIYGYNDRFVPLVYLKGEHIGGYGELN